MDIQPEVTDAAKPISDDQELAEVLAGVSQQADINQASAENLITTPIMPAMPAMPVVENAEDSDPNMPQVDPVANFTMPTIEPPVQADGDLESIKKDALTELRPLVDKLDLAPEEKFDTYLLLLRSTDDKALIAPAHAAAQNIADETRRAQALLDIVKEIDYLSPPIQ
ncbi:MAG: hypothetical protein WCK26_03355 [Candidatus Saccharibacteria bacterium]